MPVSCPTCSSDDLLGEVRPNGARVLRCQSCGHRWVREQPNAPRTFATPNTDTLRARFPQASDARPEALERVARLRRDFLGRQPHVEAETVSYRARYQFLFSEEGLTIAPPDELRTFGTTSTVAYAGRMTTFTKEWLRLGPDVAAVRLRRTIEHLLRGSGRLEDRLSALIDGAHTATFPGFKEALLTKVLAVAHSERFLPLLKYSTEADGKKEIAERLFGLGLPTAERTNWAIGRLITWSNDLLRELVEGDFDDLQHAGQFLWWAKDQPVEAAW